MARVTFFIQGSAYAALGLWPFLSSSTYLEITRNQSEPAMVFLSSSLLVVSGLGYAHESRQARHSLHLRTLAFCQAGLFAFIDIYYVTADVIPSVYLLDATFEIPVAFSWFLIWLSEKRELDEA